MDMAIKKEYEKPAMCVVQIRYLNHLLAGSPTQSKLVDDDEYDGWDSDGGQ